MQIREEITDAGFSLSPEMATPADLHRAEAFARPSAVLTTLGRPGDYGVGPPSTGGRISLGGAMGFEPNKVARAAAARAPRVVAAAATPAMQHALAAGKPTIHPGNHRIDPVQQGGVPPCLRCRPGLPLLTMPTDGRRSGSAQIAMLVRPGGRRRRRRPGRTVRALLPGQRVPGAPAHRRQTRGDVGRSRRHSARRRAQAFQAHHPHTASSPPRQRISANRDNSSAVDTTCSTTAPRW